MNFFEYLVPLVIAKPSDDGGNVAYTVDRYAGVAFFVDDKATIATCSHVIDMVQPGEILVGIDGNTGKHSVVSDIRRHPKFDFATAVFPHKPNYKRFVLKPDAHSPGQDVGAFGFTANGKDGRTVKVDSRYFKGHVVRRSDRPAKSDARSTLEISFPSHKGFSGAPLVIPGSDIVVGMLFSNLESAVEVHSITHIEEDGARYKESMHRILELGIAHSAIDIIQFLNDLRR